MPGRSLHLAFIMKKFYIYAKASCKRCRVAMVLLYGKQMSKECFLSKVFLN